MAIGSSVLFAEEAAKKRLEARAFWKKSFLVLGIEDTKWYVSSKTSILWKIAARLGFYSTLIGAMEALAVLQSEQAPTNKQDVK